MKSRHNNLKFYGSLCVAVVLCIGLGNKLQEQETTPQQVAQNVVEQASEGLQAIGDAWRSLFDGGSDSVVARTVGHAEGTRHYDGSKNPAWWGHDDPGNGVWNLGTFSYQHDAASPEQADEKQLKRLEQQTQQILADAQARGLQLSEAELLNAIDLANQAPLAALDDQGNFNEHLKRAKEQGLQGWEAILYARRESFRDPSTGNWAAPGLGNTASSIEADQLRRLKAIERVKENAR